MVVGFIYSLNPRDNRYISHVSLPPRYRCLRALYFLCSQYPRAIAVSVRYIPYVLCAPCLRAKHSVASPFTSASFSLLPNRR